jgi:ribosomal protein S18 acetylase RimI-like enzyme
MSLQFGIREFQYPADYESALRVWSSMETGVRVGRSDTPQEIEKKLQRDPDLFLVAESNGEIIGTIIGGYDGRRGMIYHLGVLPEFRNRGVATQLIEEVEKRLRAKGCVKCYLLTFADNHDAIGFYKNRGWRHQAEDIIFGKEFS